MPGVSATQTRVLDPFADHRFSNSYNFVTRIVSAGENLILPHPTANFQLELVDNDSSSGVIISPGFCFKSDVLIHCKSATYLDFKNPQNYISDDSVYGSPGGEYLLLLQYDYERTLPAKRAAYVIDKLGEMFLAHPENYLYLGSANVEIIDVGEPGERYSITEIQEVSYDLDPAAERSIYKYILPNVYGGIVE